MAEEPVSRLPKRSASVLRVGVREGRGVDGGAEAWAWARALRGRFRRTPSETQQTNTQ